MLIAAKLIKKSRVLRKCGECGSFIEPGSSALRLYGMAEDGDPPYIIFIHSQACRYGDRIDPKILAAIKTQSEEI